jgi:large subunit ribosomal protein L10
MGKEEVLKVAKLPSREILLGKVIGSLQSPLYGFVNVLNGPARKLVYALNAMKEKKGGE